jgi:AcrR family transcriptional regulator
MTRDDIIHTAFRVWGRQLYKSTSLTELAQELGVSKTALYRHFENKEALLTAMYENFFDDYAAMIRPAYEQALGELDNIQCIFIMMRAITDYYARNVNAFIFSMIHVYNSHEYEKMAQTLLIRGVDMRKFQRFEEDRHIYPFTLQLILATMTLFLAHFHKTSCSFDTPPGEAEIQKMIFTIEEKISRGLGFNKETVNSLDYEDLERRVSGKVLELEDDGLLKAVAGAVAEAGPWNASMDMVARRSGLSKSGLYAHFKSKQDMLAKFFSVEFERFFTFVEAGKAYSRDPAEQLYLVIASMADYLKSRPEILVAIDWLRTRRLDTRVHKQPQICRIVSGITFPANGENHEDIARWICFLIVSTLLHRHGGMDCVSIESSSFRTLYRFVALGLSAP